LAVSFRQVATGPRQPPLIRRRRPVPLAGSFDEKAARGQILGNDSAYVRALVSKNVDSLMVYYDPSVVVAGKDSKPKERPTCERLTTRR